MPMWIENSTASAQDIKGTSRHNHINTEVVTTMAMCQPRGMKTLSDIGASFIACPPKTQARLRRID